MGARPNVVWFGGLSLSKVKGQWNENSERVIWTVRLLTCLLLCRLILLPLLLCLLGLSIRSFSFVFLFPYSPVILGSFSFFPVSISSPLLPFSSFCLLLVLYSFVSASSLYLPCSPFSIHPCYYLFLLLPCLHIPLSLFLSFSCSPVSIVLCHCLFLAPYPAPSFIYFPFTVS